MKISIHAPSRGRLRRQVDTMVDDISIHAPSRGRPCLFVIFALPAYFNPRPLAGATRQQADLRFSPEFQSTPPRGGDPNAISSSRPIARFQSTPPRGGDDKTYYGVGYQQDFNPRPLAGATCRRQGPGAPGKGKLRFHCPHSHAGTSFQLECLGGRRHPALRHRPAADLGRTEKSRAE